MRILLVEDDRTIVEGIVYLLGLEGFETVACYDALSAEAALRSGRIDLAILDLALPDGSGYDVCKSVKLAGDIPVIFLTACDEEVNIVMGLDMGADDYITKPFRSRELISRIKSVLRRYGNSGDTIEIGNLRIDMRKSCVYRDGEEIQLTALEYRILAMLAVNCGQVLTRSAILDGIWDVAGDFVNDNTLTVYIKRLRDKLENNPQEPALIKTVRGLGYRMG